MVAYLQSSGSIMGLPARRVATVDELVWKPIDEALREPDGKFLITPAQFVPLMRVHHSEDGVAPSVVTTPALFYRRGQLVTPQRLTLTSLSVEWEDKPADFVRWGKRVMQWVRRIGSGLPRYKYHRITPKAEAARKAGMDMGY